MQRQLNLNCASSTILNKYINLLLPFSLLWLLELFSAISEIFYLNSIPNLRIIKALSYLREDIKQFFQRYLTYPLLYRQGLTEWANQTGLVLCVFTERVNDRTNELPCDCLRAKKQGERAFTRMLIAPETCYVGWVKVKKVTGARTKGQRKNLYWLMYI